MQPRKTLLDLFSTFAQLTDDRFSRWVTDAKLQRSFKNRLQQADNASETLDFFWVRYWYEQWCAQANGLAQGHLSAYLQETCYWAAHKIVANRVNLPYTLSDCFQMAIADLPNLLRGYSPAQGASLKTYANISFSNTIRDGLRQGQEMSSRTDWGLLRKVSQRQLTEALESEGLSAEKIASYRLAWICFKTCYAPREAGTSRRLSRPEPSDWEAIATIYNQQRSRQLPAEAPTATPELIETWLKRSAARLRAYLNPTTTSLNIAKYDEVGSGEILDDLPDSSNESPMTAMILEESLQERQTQRSQINTMLTAALDALDSETKALLDLYYRQKLTQQQIAAQLDIKQYTVSRRLSSAQEKLLRSLAKWSQETLHITLTSPVVKQMSILLEEWLEHFSKEGGEA
ncbi:sigma-70 family RNA polymerase sigma factor [Oscillatoria sp. FACHB-1407]|uniref:sigma-70 family RNA polymerase sigma factor n=1 Tax=Oscillatoria sp. FACHB-1407 TaxID=2692847 RepID=UPI00168944C7|nr:sigma-70 family RNA polymerase sigma factor [Oscillatoria sp. FACHB-1407]MBD2461151.1 sigma-70 family RNA polymerase sigma factor [Oscillatoria sp. FACHB-1407]